MRNDHPIVGDVFQAGVKYGGYLRRDIRAAMDRDELNGAASSSLGQCRHEIVRNIQTPGGMRVTIEFGDLRMQFLHDYLLFSAAWFKHDCATLP